MSALSFSFEGCEIHVLGNPLKPLFIANDICKALGFGNPRQAVTSHVDPEDQFKQIIDTNGGKQEVNCINESGLYALIFGSQLPQAKKFKKWVTSEVLPSIRQTGSYSLTSSTLNPSTLLEQALQSGADIEKTASQLMTVAAMLQMMSRLKAISETASPLDIQRAMLAFENELDAETKAKREHISAVRRQAVLSRYNKGE